MKHGKKYQEAVKKYDRSKVYGLAEAAALVKELSFAKFDETVELHIKLMLKKSQSVRDTVVLPNQFSAEKKVLVFAKGDKAQEALDAGATYVGDADLIEKIRGGWMDFDVAVATPDMMKDVGRLGPILGRRGLMPNPKTQTVTMDIKGALQSSAREEPSSAPTRPVSSTWRLERFPWMLTRLLRTQMSQSRRSSEESQLMQRVISSSAQLLLPPWVLASPLMPRKFCNRRGEVWNIT